MDTKIFNKILDIFQRITAKNFPKLITDTKSHIQESQKTSCKMNTKATSKNHHIYL